MYFDTIFLSFKNYLDHEITFFLFHFNFTDSRITNNKASGKIARIMAYKRYTREREEEGRGGLDMNLMKRTNADARVKTEYRR